jgi:para-nitrobenzyl esterase
VGPITDDLHTLARRMHESWVAFARTGRPEADGLPEWPRYTAQQRATMLFDLEPSVVEDPGAEDREVWAGLL